MAEHMLTTVDNPYNPFTHFDEWFHYDEASGYRTTALLARIVRSSDELSDADQSAAIERGIEEVVRENVLGVYRMIAEDGSTSMPKPLALYETTLQSPVEPQVV